MLGTLRGCHLMAGRDRRSNMETGKHYKLSSAAVSFFSLGLGFICSLLFFVTASRSLRLVIQCPPSAAMTWCTTGLKAWRSVCTGTCVRSKRGQQTCRTHQTQKTESALWQRHWTNALHSSWVNETLWDSHKVPAPSSWRQHWQTDSDNENICLILVT